MTTYSQLMVRNVDFATNVAHIERVRTRWPTHSPKWAFPNNHRLYHKYIPTTNTKLDRRERLFISVVAT